MVSLETEPVSAMDLLGGIATARAVFDTVRAGIALFKEAVSTLPEEKRTAVAQTLDEAGKQINLAEAQLAQGLGYPLCRCQWPPKIMFWVDAEKAHVCNACGHRQFEGYRISESAMKGLRRS